jgi:hypothetical protein
MDTTQGSQGGIGISAEATVASASTTPARKKTFFNMLKSPRGFELISGNSRFHGKIKG